MFNLNESKFEAITRQRHHKESLMLCATHKVSDFSFSLLQASKKFLVNLAIISLIFEQFIFVFSSTAQAADLPITPDGSTNTQIDRAANNVPIVNIAAPNAGGLSHNKFENYNVNPSGLILNNAIGSQNGVIQTQIGGLINDNANLKNSGAASVILNEVTSNNISQINGYTEIAGKKADLVLANPNGFVFNGSGFINVSRFTAVVGSSNQFNPNPNDLTFRLSDNAYAVTHGFLPKLTIMGAGIDLENVTSTDLVANVMNIVAPVYGGTNDINLRTGDASFNYLTKAVTSDNTTPGSNLPSEVAIDASALGKIQAGRIFIVATKEGFGIKYSGDLLASRAGITIDNQGNIDYNNIASEVGNISVTSQKGSITQRGISQTKNATNDLTLNAFGDITNYGQFLSARNISLTTSAIFNNQSADLNLSDNDFTISAINFTNLGQIAANRDLNITATNSLTNSAQLVGGRNLTLRASQITNDDSIYANNKITITTSNYLTNNKDIISLGMASDDGVTLNAKTLNNNKRIAAKNNITINSNALNNNTANSTILALNNINLNATSIDNSNAKIQAANSLTLRNLALNAADIAALFSVTNQATTITNTSGNFYAGSLLDFDLGNTDYTILGSLQSAGNTKIKAVNVTNQTNLQANGAIEIIATDKFINGVLAGDNSNNKIAAGTALSITAANLLSNYGTLSSNTDLTLTSTSGNINNNVNAEIIGGTGRLTLSAKNGTVYQNSLHSIVANGDYSLDVTDFVNTGRVDVAGNLTLNVANNLTNEAAAMIYAGGNMELNVVNNLTNKSGAVIFSEGSLTIQKYALTNPLYNSANNKSNLVKNISGQIISYGGNMRIDAATISNERAVNPFNAVLDPLNNGTIYGAPSASTNQYSWQLNNDGCFGHECENRYWGYYARQLTNSGSIAGVVQSGGTLTVNAGTLDNLASNISAVGNITINADTLNNHSINDPGLYYMVTTWGSRDVYSLGTTNYIRHDPGNGGHSGSRLNYNDFAQNNPSTIKSGGSITLNVTNNVSNATTNSNASTSAIATQTPSLTNALNVSDVTTNGTISVDLSNYFNGPDTNGLFQKSTNPNGPLFETRSEFLDQSRFFGSNYFYQRIGLNLTDVQTEFELTSKRLVGDQFFQTKIIEEQLRTITKNSFLLSNSETNINNEIKSLLDNAADEYARLGLTTNTALTKTQINNLQKDIVWFETQTIDGAVYIVPKIYLTQATRDALKNGNMTTSATIYAAGDVNINSSSGKITNAGSITGNNVALASSGDILNKNFSNITALSTLSLTSSTGSISNFSKIKAGGALSLTAAKDITNSSTVLTNDSNLLASGISGYVSNGMASSDTGFIQSKTLETAGITAGSLTVNAGNDFNNYAANITTTGNADITAGNNANFSTLELRNRTETSWGHKSKGGSQVVDTTTNVASNINIGGNLSVVTTGLAADAATDGGSNINIIGSNVSTTGNLNLAAKDNVNVASAIDTYHKEERSNSKSFTVKKTYFATTDNTTNVSSNLTSQGDVNISSGKDTNIIASNLTGKGNGNILVGAYTDYDTGSATYGQTLFNTDANLNILNGVDTKRFYSESTKTKTGLSLENALMTAAMVAAVVAMGPASVGVIAAAGAGGGAVGAVNQQKTTKTELHYDETIVKSNLSFGKNLDLTSTKDTTIQASNITTGTENVAGQKDLNITTGGNLLLTSATENHQTSYQLKDKGNYFFKNGSSGNVNTKVVNTEIDTGSGAGNLNLNVGNTIVAQYKQGSREDTSNQKLAYLNQLDPSITVYNSIEETNKSWDQTSRGLTGAGQAVVAITATALTMGAMSGVGAAAGSTAGGAASGTAAAGTTTATAATTTAATTTATAATTTAATTTATAATTAAATTTTTAATTSALATGLNAATVAAASSVASQASISAINNQGRLGKVAKDITSKEALKNTAIAAVSAGLAAGATTLISPTAVSTTNASLATNLKTSFTEVATQTVASTAAQSAINGDSFTEALKNQGKNVLIYTVAKVGANEIGSAYNAGTINKPLQLTLHAGLGCGVGAATGGDCGSGAVAGVAAEVIAQSYRDAQLKNLVAENGAITTNDINNIRQTGSALAGVGGAISSVFAGTLSGQDDSQMAKNAWEGSRIGKNAAENNALTPDSILDATMVAYDVAKIGYGKYTKNEEMVKEGKVDLAADSSAFLIPGVPAGLTKLKRILGKSDEIADSTKLVQKIDVPSSNKADFYVGPNGEIMPSTAYRYMDSNSPAAKKAIDTGSSNLDSYFGFEKIDSATKVQDRYQILPQWSNTKVRSEFDTLQLFDKNGNLNAEVPFSHGGRTSIPEPFANSYPQSTHGNGGGQQMVPKNPQQIKLNNTEVLND